MKKTIFLALALLATIVINAQERVSGNLVLNSKSKKSDLLAIKLPSTGEYTRMDVTQDCVTLEVMDFGNQGQTFLVEMNLPSVGLRQTLSWSGARYRMEKAVENKNGNTTNAYVLFDGNTSRPLLTFALVQTGGKLATMLDLVNNKGMISDISKGMTLNELNSKISALGVMNADLKQSHRVGNLNVYACRIAGLRDNVVRGTVSVTKNDYGHFYFNAQGKLVKWIIFNN